MRVPRNEPLSAKTGGKTRGPAQRRGAGPALVAERAGGTHRAAQKPAPERRCILTGLHDDRDTLIRLAISPDGEVLPDVLARAPGRGAWIGVNRAELDAAIAKGRLKGALARAFKGAAIQSPADLGPRIAAALERALADRLGIELRAGHIVLGTEKIAAAARGGTVRWLAHAADAGEDGSGKLAQAWRVGEGAEGSGKAGIILPLDRAALSVALGRDNVVHLALTDAAAANRVAGLLGRLLHFAGQDPVAERQPDGAAVADPVSDDVSDVKDM